MKNGCSLFKFQILSLAVVCTLNYCTVESRTNQKETTASPDVIFIMADEGMKFTNVYAGSPV